MNMMGGVVAMLVALCWEHDLDEWRLGWNIRLLTIAYAVNINPSIIKYIYICLVV